MPVSVIDLVSSGHWRHSGLFGKVGRQQDEASWNALVTVGLEDFATRPISALSSGQFQRVLFARILVQDARLILLDEPFNAVDTRTTQDLLQLVDRWRQEGCTLVAVGLEDFATRPISALSSGQFQRVLFARILVQDARLILLDEPFNAVDARTTQDLLQLVDRWRQEGRTVVAVLHDQAQVHSHFPQTLLMAREVIAWGDTAEVLTEARLRKASETAAHWLAKAPLCNVDGSPA